MADKPKQNDESPKGPSLEIPGDLADFMDAADLHYEDGAELDLSGVAKPEAQK